MRFRIAPHSSRIGESVVEIFDSQNRFIAMISPGNSDQELRVISKHLDLQKTVPGPDYVRVFMRPSNDPAAPLTPGEVALEAAIINLHRVILSDPKRKLAILTKRVSYDILPSEVTVEEAQKGTAEIVAVMQNLEKPTHVTKDTGRTRSTEMTSDEVIVRCDACQSESDEQEWIALGDCCPVCAKQRKLDPREKPEVRKLIDYIKDELSRSLKHFIAQPSTPQTREAIRQRLLEAYQNILLGTPGVTIVAAPARPEDDPNIFYGKVLIEKQALGRLDPRWLSKLGITPEQAAECGEEGLAIELERLKWAPDQEDAP